MRIAVNVEVDILSKSVIDAITGNIYATESLRVDEIFIAEIHKKNGWKFNWKKECKNPRREIFRLHLREDASMLLGLISLEIKDDHVHVHLAESSPQNIGKEKQYLGIGGNLFAFACKISYENGFDGVIAFYAKTKLIKHYSVTLGAVLLSNQRMIIPEKNAYFLFSKYYKDEKK